MTIVVDHNKNIQRIVDNIKADSTVFDNGVTTGKLRSVEFGDRDNNQFNQNQMPYAFVTTRSNSQRTSYATGFALINQQNQVTVEYDVVIVAHTKDKTTTSQKQLYDLVKNLHTVLQKEPTFKIQPAATADPIFSRSIVNAMPWKEDTRGQLTTSITLVITAVIGSIGKFSIGPVSNVELLGFRPEKGRNSTVRPDTDGDTKVSKGEFTGRVFLDYIYDSSTYDALEALIVAGTENTLTVTNPQGTRTFLKTVLNFQRETTSIDNLDIVTLEGFIATA